MPPGVSSRFSDVHFPYHSLGWSNPEKMTRSMESSDQSSFKTLTQQPSGSCHQIKLIQPGCRDILHTHTGVCARRIQLTLKEKRLQQAHWEQGSISVSIDTAAHLSYILARLHYFPLASFSHVVLMTFGSSFFVVARVDFFHCLSF